MNLTARRTRQHAPARRPRLRRHAPPRRLGAQALRTVEARITGTVVVAGDSGWADVRRAWNFVGRSPVAVALVTSVEDVVSVREWARAHGLQTDARGGEWWGLGIYRGEGTVQRASEPAVGGALG